jgi:hypothetical protein
MKKLTGEEKRAIIRKEKINVIENEYLSSVANLYYRWQDEKEFEDIKDYEEKFYNILKERFADLKSVKIKKRPFTFEMKFDLGILFLKINSRNYEFIIAVEESKKLTKGQSNEIAKLAQQELKKCNRSDYTDQQYARLEQLAIQNAKRIILRK